MSIVDYLNTNALYIVGASAALAAVWSVVLILPFVNRMKMMCGLLVYQVTLFPVWFINVAWWFALHLLFLILFFTVTWLSELTQVKPGGGESQ